MKCEPPRNPWRDIIFSDLCLFTASAADTFKREKKSHPEQASEFKINHSQWNFWVKDKYTGVFMHTHTHTQMHKYTHVYVNSYVNICQCKYRCKYIE